MTKIELDELIPQYARDKEGLDNYKKICDKENARIKTIMAGLSLKDYESGDYRAVYTVSKRDTMNEEKLLEIAHNYGIPEIVKTKEYIDFDALEKLIYDGKIPNEVVLEMDKAKETKEVVTLRVSKIKKKKEDDD